MPSGVDAPEHGVRCVAAHRADGARLHENVWEFDDCEFLDAHDPAFTEIRPAEGSTCFLAGPRCAVHACQASMAEMREALALR